MGRSDIAPGAPTCRTAAFTIGRPIASGWSRSREMLLVDRALGEACGGVETLRSQRPRKAVPPLEQHPAKCRTGLLRAQVFLGSIDRLGAGCPVGVEPADQVLRHLAAAG